MDHPYENTMLLPANYAVIPEDEMTYLGGGEDVTLGQIGKYTLILDTDAATQFCVNVIVNSMYALTSSSFSYITGLLQSGHDNGLSLKGTIYHTWGKLETPWSRVAAVGLTGLAGVYAGYQVLSIYNTLKSLFTSIVAVFPNNRTAEAAAA